MTQLDFEKNSKNTGKLGHDRNSYAHPIRMQAI